MSLRSPFKPSVGRGAALLLLLAGALGVASCAKAISPLSGGGGDGEGGSGGGASTDDGNTGVTTTGTTTGATTTGTTTGTATSTGTGGVCDGTGDCGTCADCAANGACASPLDACVASTDCGDFVTCLDGCADGDTACIDDCVAAHPTGSQLYLDYASCVVCAECYVDCDGAGACS